DLLELALPRGEVLVVQAPAPVAGDRGPVGGYAPLGADVRADPAHDGVGLSVDKDVRLPLRPRGAAHGPGQRGVRGDGGGRVLRIAGGGLGGGPVQPREVDAVRDGELQLMVRAVDL